MVSYRENQPAPNRYNVYLMDLDTGIRMVWKFKCRNRAVADDEPGVYIGITEIPADEGLPLTGSYHPRNRFGLRRRMPARFERMTRMTWERAVSLERRILEQARNLRDGFRGN